MIIASCFLPHHVTANSQCEQTFTTTTRFDSYRVEAGVVTCFRCVFDGVEDPNTLWRILDGNIPVAINSSDGEVNGGVLTISDPITIVPNTGVALQNQRTLLCDRVSGAFLQYRIFLTRRGMHTYIHSLQPLSGLFNINLVGVVGEHDGHHNVLWSCVC